ncbi:MAG: phospho-sugar mutase [Humibacillus sp.]|nr:phospho-sugar mutase [Humibacillus sp.]MDN5778608.1 phospho-sugar mutase [Humibacillus sp.]
MDPVLTQAADWMDADPDAADREELGALLAAARAGDPAALADLSDRFAGELTFGTAGLRGRIGAGQHRMNTAVVTTATAGLCSVLLEDLGAGFHVVIGYDARHRSSSFARTAAAVVVAAGGRASLMPSALPTPLLAFAVLHLDADAGIMVTASHNPPADNGYKAYLGRRMSEPGAAGAQIVPPTDARIAAGITAAGAAKDVGVSADGWRVLGDDVIDAYTAQTVGLVAPAGPRDLRIVLTAMHGVGSRVAVRVLAEAGFADVHLVAEQCEPDPEFPTVPFPNPEEPGALDLAYAKAREVDADLIIALDPDADRSSAAVPDGSVAGGWRQLTGDQVGWLLGEQAARAHHGDGSAALARSIVSSSLLDHIATSHGLRAIPTLTGFKWISRAPGLVFGYEEAIGYCVNPSVVRDKDGISASAKMCELAAGLKAEGATIDDVLDRLAIAHGLFTTSPLTFRVEDVSLIAAGMARLLASPPSELAGSSVVENDDLSQGWAGLPPTEGVRLSTERHDRVIVRPSGTEPKLKCYLEVLESVSTHADLPDARERSQQRLAQIKDELARVLGF